MYAVETQLDPFPLAVYSFGTLTLFHSLKFLNQPLSL